MNKHKIAVIGVGTAGLTSLCHCLGWLPEDWEVYSISDPKISILGIGESTTVTIPKSLYLGARFTMFRDSDHVDGTLKQGVKYVDWRDEDFYSQIIPPSHGIHFNNFKLKEFCFSRFRTMWGTKFIEVSGKIDSVENEKNVAVVMMEGQRLEFNFVIDCRGYPEDYSDYTMASTIPVNHALVNMVPEPGDWDWTYHVAHRNGWMFGIPLKTRQGWGYLYNDIITERADAIDDIAERFKTKPEDLQLREFSFKNYYAKKFIDGRIVKNGNRALFFEPIEALSGFFYDEVMRYFFDTLYGKYTDDEANNHLTRIAEDMVSMIAYIYHGGSKFDSEFWRKTKQSTTEHLKNDQRFNDYLNAMRSMSMADRSAGKLFGVFTTFSWVDFDKHLGYNYITNSKEPKEW